MALNLNKAKIGRKILLLAVACGLLGVLNFFQPMSLALYALQAQAAVKPVSGDIVVVGIDSPSIRAIGRWPWARDKQAELLRQIDAYDPAAIYVDLGYQGKTTTYADNALRNTLANLKAPTKVIALATRENGSASTIFSHSAAVGNIATVSAYTPYLFGFVWNLPLKIETVRGPLPTVAASIAKLEETNSSTFMIDYTYDPGTIPVFSAKDVLSLSVKASDLRGKTVLLGTTDHTQNDIHSMPGWGEQPGVLVHVLGAETLREGIPPDLGWLLFFAIAAAVCGLQLTRAGFKLSAHINWVSALTILTVSTWLTTRNIGNDPIAAIALLGSVSIVVARQKAALLRSQRNTATGFFNMTGYMVEEVVSNAMFIGATVMRAETRLGYVRQEDEVAIMREVGHRLSTVIDEQQLTHNDNKQFLWEMPSIATGKLADHLEGLRQLFADPLVINGRKIDIDIHFGVDRNVNKNIRSRMESALEASIEASKTQSTFNIATTADFDRLLKSQFSQEFETAVNNGDIHLMLEAQQNLSNGQVDSAAASLRWTHPAYGQIDTAKLFAHARETGNLKRVSQYLCEQAILSAGQLTQKQPGFTVSVKISTDILSDREFGLALLEVAKAANCRPANVTLEVVDVHEYKFNEAARGVLDELRQFGFRIGIGNFGITDADIDLLKRFQPDEIFLIKSFSAELLGSTSNEMFASGALRIAKASNIRTTADGIDDRDVLTALRRHGCDRGKGKIISMPLNLNNFSALYLKTAEAKFG